MQRPDRIFSTSKKRDRWFSRAMNDTMNLAETADKRHITGYDMAEIATKLYLIHEQSDGRIVLPKRGSPDRIPVFSVASDEPVGVSIGQVHDSFQLNGSESASTGYFTDDDGRLSATYIAAIPKKLRRGVPDDLFHELVHAAQIDDAARDGRLKLKSPTIMEIEAYTASAMAAYYSYQGHRTQSFTNAVISGLVAEYFRRKNRPMGSTANLVDHEQEVVEFFSNSLNGKITPQSERLQRVMANDKNRQIMKLALHLH